MKYSGTKIQAFVARDCEKHSYRQGPKKSIYITATLLQKINLDWNK